jgi:3-methyladenine DNA glycosylase AlkD
MLKHLKRDLAKLASPAKAKVQRSFFKTGKGQYGAGDIFLGITVPELRATVKKYLHLTLTDIKKLLESKIHEHRAAGLMLLVEQYKKATAPVRQKIVDFYLAHTKHINNWDLVDLSAYHIVGDYLLDKPAGLLERLARSKTLWERRIAMVSTYALIRKNQFTHPLRIAKRLLADEHDLMHKAVGWMLREVGKRDERALRAFLDRHVRHMPRTALRYAIERFPEILRKHYLSR